MRKRRYRKASLPTQNLDSFLDILTNTVGVLMFMTLFITLVAVESSNIVRTPLVSKTDKKPRFFEVRNNRLMFIDDQTIDRQLNQVLPNCKSPDIPKSVNEEDYYYYLNQIEAYQTCRLSLIDTLQNFRGRTEYYTARFSDLGSMIYEPINEKGGELPEEMTKDNSEFNQVLKELNPNHDYLAFIVRPDSFAAFRTARKEADKLGFDVGWEPFTPDTPIIFGSGGRTIGVQ